MRQAVILAVVGKLLMAMPFGLDIPLDVVREPHRVVGKDDALRASYTQTSAVNEILVTTDNQIVVELAPDEATSPNPFDLNERTLVFTPDGKGRYSREVKALEWVEEIGEEAESGAVIMLESFDFPFAGQRYDSFHLGPPGVLAFGGPFSSSMPPVDSTMQEIAEDFVSSPTISVLYKPNLDAVRHVAHWPNRIVITWSSTELNFGEHGVRPKKFARFQTALSADGSIRFNYIDVPYGDGIVGLFQGDDLAEPLPAEVDLSQSDSSGSNRHHEVFHYRSVPNTFEIACHLIDVLGDEFDLFVFHSEFRLNYGGNATPWAWWPFNGHQSESTRSPPCGGGRLKGHWLVPVWMRSKYFYWAEPFYDENERFFLGSWLFAHEFAHSWTAYLQYDRSGRQEPLHDTDHCFCHWRLDLHSPAAFPWRAEQIDSASIMGGAFWRDNENGTFTRLGNSDGGFSWLDLYAMGLAAAQEVPDMFIVRNLQAVDDPHSFTPTYTGEKEIVSIDQIVAAEGPRVPGLAHSQKVFNAGFVYLLEPGQTPSGDLLGLHAKYPDKVLEYWSHITGGRSQITAVMPGSTNNQPPRPIGTIPAQTLTEEGRALELDVKDYFDDPDGDPLSYKASSSNNGVVLAEMSASVVMIKPGTVGPALVTVTVADGRGGLAYQTIEIAVEPKPDTSPSDFGFVPVILNAAGRNNAYFTSELTLTNRGAEEAALHYTYTAHAGGGSGTATDTLASGQQRIQPDAIGYLASLGIPVPGSGNRIGTLRVEVSGSSDVSLTTRTTTDVPDGRAGLAYLGVAEEEGFEEAVYLCGLRENTQDRSNVAVQNMGSSNDGPITLRTTVFSGEADDTGPRTLGDLELEPGEFHQYNQVLKAVGRPAQGYVKVEKVKGDAPFYAYGVINDNFNSDGSFVFPVREDSLESTRGQTLPVIIETGNFTSELTVTNFSGVAKAVEFRFVAEAVETDDDTATFSLTLKAGQQRILPDIVEELRRKEVDGIGPPRRAFVGPLFATVAEADMSGIVIGARTGAPDQRGGQYGLFYNGVPYGSASTESAWIYGLQQNAENRSNLALVNTGEINDSSSTFEITIYDGSGDAEPRTKRVTLGPRRWAQENGILGKISQGYVQVRKTSGNNPFVSYGVINDGGRPGERSGDGAFLLPQE